MTAERGPYRVGIVGAGGISKLHLEGISRHPERTRVVALCDPDAETCRTRAAEHGIDQTYSRLDEMIAKAGLDVAVVCTPTHVRGEVVLPLVEAKIPVFCEKPFAETYAEAAEMERAARSAGVPVAVNQNFRRYFTFTMAREVLAQGKLGKPLHLAQTVAGLRRDTGWRLDRSRYVMAVMSIHWFDGYRWLLREEPETVYCRHVNSSATAGGEDTAISVILRFRQGAVVSLSESFSSFLPHQSCRLDCEAGGLRMDYETLTEFRPDGEPIEHRNPFDLVEATWYLLNDLMQAVEARRAPETGATDNLNSVRILEAAYRSAEEARVVRLAEIE